MLEHFDMSPPWADRNDFIIYRGSYQHSTPRMSPVVHLTQPISRDVGVDLGGVEAGMTQQSLDRSQIRTVLQQMGGTGVAQQVAAA